MKLLIRLAVLLVAVNFLTGTFRVSRTEEEAPVAIPHPTATSMRNHLQAAAADAFEWAASSLREDTF